LDATLKSITQTTLPENYNLVVIDDCSDDPLAKQYLLTDGTIMLPKLHEWRIDGKFVNASGKFRNLKGLKGIKSRFEIIQPESKKGVRGGIFWCIDAMMKRFKDSPAVIIIEADSVFHKDWYIATELAYGKCKKAHGPNGESIGLLSCYDRKGKGQPGMDWGWRSVKKLHSGHWGCANGIGGVMYLVTRNFYQAAITEMQKKQNPGLRSGDTMLQACCGTHEFTIAVTKPSFCQHIGYMSEAWPEKGYRYARNFRKPFVFEKFDKEGRAYSEDWIV